MLNTKLSATTLRNVAALAGVMANIVAARDETPRAPMASASAMKPLWQALAELLIEKQFQSRLQSLLAAVGDVVDTTDTAALLNPPEPDEAAKRRAWAWYDLLLYRHWLFDTGEPSEPPFPEPDSEDPDTDGEEA